MEFLQTIFGEEALTAEQFEERLKGAGKDGADIKIADLSQGEYVSKNKYETLEAELGTHKTRLEEANTKLEGYDPNWKEEATQAQLKAQEQIDAMKFDFAINEKLQQEQARNVKAVKALLNLDGLKAEDGNIVGLDEQLKKIKEENAYMFADTTPPPSFSVPPNGQGHGKEKTWRDTINENYFKTKGE